jgi:hypothetical protein
VIQSELPMNLLLMYKSQNLTFQTASFSLNLFYKYGIPLNITKSVNKRKNYLYQRFLDTTYQTQYFVRLYPDFYNVMLILLASSNR